jgi:phosphohistidine phosphatase SixA
MRLFISLLFLFLTQQLVDAAEFTTILVVRHGEKQSGTGDVPLSEQGQARAVELASIASLFNVSSVYCTNTLRSKQTADPTANIANRHIYETPSRAWANQIIAENRGNAVLIVGHSNTLPIIVRHFGGGSVTVGEERYCQLLCSENLGLSGDLQDSVNEFLSFEKGDDVGMAIQSTPALGSRLGQFEHHH